MGGEQSRECRIFSYGGGDGIGLVVEENEKIFAYTTQGRGYFCVGEII